MSLALPTHQSLALGCVADTKILNELSKIKKLADEVNALRDNINNKISLYRGIEMLSSEIKSFGFRVEKNENLDVPDDPLKKIKDSQDNISDEIKELIAAYVSKKIDNDTKIQEIYAGIPDNHQMPSLFYAPTKEDDKIITMPILWDTMKLDVQFFTHGKHSIEDIQKNIENNNKHIQNNPQATEDIRQALSKEGIEHTLVINVNCTHKNAVFLNENIDPYIARNVWNEFNSNNKIDFQNITDGDDIDDNDELNVVNGAIYGSYFVGMVHTMNTDKYDTSPDNIQKTKKLINDIQSLGGSMVQFDYSFDKIKELLNANKVEGHLNIITSGVLSSMSTKDQQKQNFNMESLITAFDNYLSIISTIGKDNKSMPLPVGVPIGFFTKKIKKSDIIRAWMEQKIAEGKDKKEEDKNK